VLVVLTAEGEGNELETGGGANEADLAELRREVKYDDEEMTVDVAEG